MTYARVGDNVIEFNGRRKKLSYDRKVEPPPPPTKEAPAKPASIGVRVVGAIARRVSRWVRRQWGVEIIMAQASFREDGYAFWLSLSKNGVQKMALFSEEPERNFRVWPG